MSEGGDGREEHATTAGEVPATRRSLWRWGWIALLVVAAVLIAVLRYGPRATSWRLWHVHGAAGELLWNGTAYAAADSGALRAALRGGGTFELGPAAELEFVHGGDVSIQLLPETAGRVSGPPRRLSERLVTMRLERGGARFSTGVRFRGARLEVETPDTRVRISGTTASVFVSLEGTSVCALEGEATMQDRDGASGVVAGGGRRLVYRDRRPAVSLELDGAEREHLGRFLDQQRDILHE